jgi:hypothetical protein
MPKKKRTEIIQMTRIKENWKRVSVLAVGGGSGFWAANFAISRTSIAAEYRAALSISYLPMLLESLLGGLIIGFCVSYLLLRFFDKIPTRNPILKSLILSLITLIIVTVIIEVPASFVKPTSNALSYFLIGALFNVIRIPVLGITIGYLYKRLYKGINPIVIPVSPHSGKQK